MTVQFDLFVDQDQWHDKVISEKPYVKIMGKVGWSTDYHCWAAVAQVESAICVVGLRLKENGKILYRPAFP